MFSFGLFVVWLVFFKFLILVSWMTVRFLTSLLLACGAFSWSKYFPLMRLGGLYSIVVVLINFPSVSSFLQGCHLVFSV